MTKPLNTEKVPMEGPAIILEGPEMGKSYKNSSQRINVQKEPLKL